MVLLQRPIIYSSLVDKDKPNTPPDQDAGLEAEVNEKVADTNSNTQPSRRSLWPIGVSILCPVLILFILVNLTFDAWLDVPLLFVVALPFILLFSKWIVTFIRKGSPSEQLKEQESEVQLPSPFPFILHKCPWLYRQINTPEFRPYHFIIKVLSYWKLGFVGIIVLVIINDASSGSIKDTLMPLIAVIYLFFSLIWALITG